MPGEAVLAWEGLVAEWAGEGLHARVGECMSLQVVLLYEAPPARLAHEGARFLFLKAKTNKKE